jgi:hypothetical protein
MIYREYEIEPSRRVAVSGTLGFDAQARGFGPAHAVGEGLKPAASNRRVFLLNWAGAATADSLSPAAGFEVRPWNRPGQSSGTPPLAPSLKV